jgi:hypothetical protein
MVFATSVAGGHKGEQRYHREMVRILRWSAVGRSRTTRDPVSSFNA